MHVPSNKVSVRRLSRLDSTYLCPRVRTVVDEDQSGDDVDDEPEYGDEVGREPERHFADQPVPPGLQEAVQDALARATVLVLAQPFQLAGRQHLFIKLHACGLREHLQHRRNRRARRIGRWDRSCEDTRRYPITGSCTQLRRYGQT